MTQPTIESPLMTVREVAEYLHVHPTTAYRLVRKGMLPGMQVGGSWRFDVRAIDQWIKEQGNVAEGKQVRRKDVALVQVGSSPTRHPNFDDGDGDHD